MTTIYRLPEIFVKLFQRFTQNLKRLNIYLLVIASTGNVWPAPAASFERTSSESRYALLSDKYVKLEKFLLSFSNEVRFDCEGLACDNIQELQERSDSVFKLRDFSGVYIFIDRNGDSISNISLGTINQILHSVSIDEGKIEIALKRSKLDSGAACDPVVIESALTIKVLGDGGRVGSVGKLNGNRSLPTCDGGQSYLEPNDDASQAVSTMVVAIENVTFSLEYP